MLSTDTSKCRKRELGETDPKCVVCFVGIRIEDVKGEKKNRFVERRRRMKEWFFFLLFFSSRTREEENNHDDPTFDRSKYALLLQDQEEWTIQSHCSSNLFQSHLYSLSLINN